MTATPDDIPIMVAARIFKRLGKPARNAPKSFAQAEVMAEDRGASLSRRDSADRSFGLVRGIVWKAIPHRAPPSSRVLIRRAVCRQSRVRGFACTAVAKSRGHRSRKIQRTTVCSFAGKSTRRVAAELARIVGFANDLLAIGSKPDRRRSGNH